MMKIVVTLRLMSGHSTGIHTFVATGASAGRTSSVTVDVKKKL